MADITAIMLSFAGNGQRFAADAVGTEAIGTEVLSAILGVLRLLLLVLQGVADHAGMHLPVHLRDSATASQRNVHEVLIGARRVWSSVRSWATAAEADFAAVQARRIAASPSYP